MVDLVKARKKAKERKSEAEQLQSVAEESPPPETPTGDERPTPAPRAEAVPESATVEDEKARMPDTTAMTTAAAAATPVAAAIETAAPAVRRLEEIKRALGTSRFANQESVRAAATEELLELLLLLISGEVYAVPIEKIVEIIAPRPATNVPNSDESVIGIISLRGTIVTILDLRRRLGHANLAAVSPETRIVVVEQEGETAGFVVDKVLRVIRLDASVVGPAPVLTALEQTDLIRGVFQHGNNLAILLDLEKLLRS